MKFTPEHIVRMKENLYDNNARILLVKQQAILAALDEIERLRKALEEISYISNILDQKGYAKRIAVLVTAALKGDEG